MRYPIYSPQDRLDAYSHTFIAESGYFTKANPRARRQPKKQVRQAGRSVIRGSSRGWTA